MRNLRNSAWLIAGELVSRALALLIIQQLTNYLGVTRYGELSLAFAWGNIMVILADFGLNTYLIKAVAREPGSTGKIFAEILPVKFGLMSITLVGLMTITWLVPGLPQSVVVLGGVSVVLANFRTFVEAWYRAKQLMTLEVISKIVAMVALASGCVIVIWQHGSLDQIALAYALTSLSAVIFSTILLRIYITKLSVAGTWQQWKNILIGAWPFALSLACNYIFNYEDAVILGTVFHQINAVGLYTAAYKPIFVLTALAGMIINGYLPSIAAAYRNQPNTLRQLVKELVTTNLTLALPLAIGGTVLAPYIIAWLYRPEYAMATLAFQILLWSTLIIYFWAALGNTLQVCDQQTQYTKIFITAAIMNTILNLVLINWWSLYGAAAATGLTQLYIAYRMYRTFQRHLPTDIWSELWRPLLSAIGMGILVYVVPGDWWLRLAIGMITYATILYLIKGWPQQLWRNSQ